MEGIKMKLVRRRIGKQLVDCAQKLVSMKKLKGQNELKVAFSRLYEVLKDNVQLEDIKFG